MKKFALIGILILVITCIAMLAHTRKNEIFKSNELIAQWEKLAEKGDTAAMHRLIKFYDENSSIYVEVEEVVEANGTEWDAAEVDSLNNTNKTNAEMSQQYAERLEYWLNKGIVQNDPIALLTKGIRLYYEDEPTAIDFLSRAADAGSAQAALFCGSACLNQGKGDEAFKYLSLAYKLGAPSAGWHLAMCYSAGIGTEPNHDKAIEVMRHAANLNYPEAVSEMRRIEPNNLVWQHKADSLDITFPDFPIIP
ncbi:MAG: sel1 repeat family protein [Bacteroides sp.]|nr:sel1 repeat family protein [Bacteroides sp.]